MSLRLRSNNSLKPLQQINPYWTPSSSDPLLLTLGTPHQPRKSGKPQNSTYNTQFQSENESLPYDLSIKKTLQTIITSQNLIIKSQENTINTLKKQICKLKNQKQVLQGKLKQRGKIKSEKLLQKLSWQRPSLQTRNKPQFFNRRKELKTEIEVKFQDLLKRYGYSVFQKLTSHRKQKDLQFCNKVNGIKEYIQSLDIVNKEENKIDIQLGDLQDKKRPQFLCERNTGRTSSLAGSIVVKNSSGRSFSLGRVEGSFSCKHENRLSNPFSSISYIRRRPLVIPQSQPEIDSSRPNSRRLGFYF